jgi:hypothetical protein
MNVARFLLIAWFTATLPTAGAADLHGFWQSPGPMTLQVVNHAAVPFTARGEALFEHNRAAIAAHDRSVDLTLRCASPGAPRIMLLPRPFEILQQSDHLLFVFQWNQLFRQIVMSDKRDPYVLPSAMGFSAGRWDGDTLVITTTDFSDTTFLDGAGLPHSDKLKLVERFSLQNRGRRLEWLATIDDPEVYSHPWNASARFDRVALTSLSEDVCVDRVAAGRPAIEVTTRPVHAPADARLRHSTP